jgi:hypothetical protein
VTREQWQRMRKAREEARARAIRNHNHRIADVNDRGLAIAARNNSRSIEDLSLIVGRIVSILETIAGVSK